MNIRLPPLNALRAFDASARHRSFTRAASELNVTPAAISHQIKGLEEFLGASLFRRAKGTLMLTEAGQQIMPGVRKGFVAFREAMENFGQHHESGPINVALTPSFGAKWLIPKLEHFNRAHPEIDIRISTTLELIDYEDEGVEIGVRFGQGAYPELVSERLLTSEITPVCSPKLLQGDAPLEKPEDLRHFTLLHDESPLVDETQPNWAMWLRVVGVNDVDPSHGVRFDMASACQNAAVEGVGVALGRTALLEDDLASGKLVRPFEVSLPSTFAYFVVYPESSRKRPKVMAFRDWLFKEVQDAEAAGPPEREARRSTNQD